MANSLIRLKIDGYYDEVRLFQSVELKEDTYYFFNSTFRPQSYCLSKSQMEYFEIPGFIISINPVLNISDRILLNIISDDSALSITSVLSNFYVLSESFDVMSKTHVPQEFQSCVGTDCPLIDFYCTDIKYQINEYLPGELSFTFIDLIGGDSITELKINDKRLPEEIKQVFLHINN